LLVQLGELDERVNATWPDYQKDLDSLNVAYKMHMYEGAMHGFYNDSTARYDEKNAALAWQRTLDFFAEKLS
jgi:carboxymethylenebutenolidase